jgi:Ca2+-binding RTX toxin-like protein
MAIVKGNATGNTLNGVGVENDIIYGLGGNDIINGGAGNDTLYGEAPFFQGKYYLFSIAGTWVAAQADAVSVGGSLVTVNSAAENQWLTTKFTGQGNLWLGLTDQTVEGTFAWINGETATATYRNWLGGQQPGSVTGLEDYASLTIASGFWTTLSNASSQLGIIEIATVLTGNDSLDGGTGLDTLVGGVGNDTLNGGTESDTADYSSLTQAITLLPTGTVNKGAAGTDQLISVERIIGATGQANVIDASTATNFGAAATVNINLTNQSVVVTTGIATPPSISLSVVNFVNAIGTNNNDTITGDLANNTLSGGGGNDILNGGTGGNDTLNGGIGNDSLIGGTGSDRLDGGTGTDTANYSALGQAITLLPTGTVNKGIAGTDQLVGIETVIGATGLANVIDASTATNFGAAATININLATQSVVVNTGIAVPPSISLTAINFVNAIGTNNNDTITGDAVNNTLSGGNGNDILNGGTGGNDTLNGGIGNDSLIGGTGNDRLDGGTNTDTADYSSLTQAITLLPTGTVNKGIAGTDQLVGIETIIGATGQANVIDASTATNFGAAATVNINLATQSVVVTTGIATPPSISLTAINFVNAIGTNNNDTITGDIANNTLSGGSGNDTLHGGSGNDNLNGGIGNDQIFGDKINLTSEFFSYNGKLYLLSNEGTWTEAQAQAVSLGGNLVTVNNEAENQFLVDTFGEEALWIGLTDEVVEGQFKWVNGEAFTYKNWEPGQPDDGGGTVPQDYAYINFAVSGILGTWDDGKNDSIFRGIIEIYSNDTIIGSTGNDTINGGVGTDTANYSAIGQAITLLPTGTVNKGIAGTDQLIGIETIIGATGLANVIDASTATNFGSAATININLTTQSVVVTTGIATPPSISLSVVNFVNVIGTNNNDTITGDIANNTLSGGSGDDILKGGTGNDNLNGGAGNDEIFGDVDVVSPFFSFNGKTYLLSDAGSWTEAQAQAISLGGNLVTVNDATENQFLVNTFGTERLWIGLTDEVVEGQFKWVNGEAVTYTNWFPGEPNDAGGNEDYVEINVNGITGKWNDLPNSLLALRGIIEIAASNDTIIGSTGNDTINGGFGTDTVNYTGIGEAVTLLATGILDKGGAGIDELISIETIIGEAGQANTIDSSTAGGTTKVNVNLTTGSLVVNADGIPTPLSFTVTNFVNVFGTDNNDTITGSSADNTLNGEAGNDTVNGSAGDDLINGGLGTDTVNYSSLTDAITLLSSGVVNKGIFGTDQILNVETVIGATGQLNTIDASTGVATTTSLNADLAVNRLTINGLPAPINSVTFNVQNFVNIVGTTQGDTLKGNNLANELVGNAGNDTIQGNNGDDILDGGDGNDQLLGGENNDQLYGGLGNDILQGDNGNDLLFADLGNDTLRGGNGDDILDGGVGNDSLLGGANNDTLYGDIGDDILNGEAGNDLLYGEEGNDRVFGGEGNDQLSGDQGRDLLYGGNGNDILFGNNDNDSLFGDAGNDLLFGGAGFDLLQGGLGNDIFAISLSEGSDTIQDFQDGFDTLGLGGGLQFSQLTINQLGTNTFIRNTSNAELLFTLQNVSSALITSVDFVTV